MGRLHELFQVFLVFQTRIQVFEVLVVVPVAYRETKFV